MDQQHAMSVSEGAQVTGPSGCASQPNHVSRKRKHLVWPEGSVEEVRTRTANLSAVRQGFRFSLLQQSNLRQAELCGSSECEPHLHDTESNVEQSGFDDGSGHDERLTVVKQLIKEVDSMYGTQNGVGLILARRVDEKIVISTSDGPIWITLIESRGSESRIAVDAPASCTIDREEIFVEKCICGKFDNAKIPHRYKNIIAREKARRGQKP